ncbi:sensor of ECF-type sigma factor [Xanthomarina spongicola]|uniref:LTXXQ motif family protein n=1 Tax=Xanthomarina spongicola TaxID=570520 RepID=A0A316DJ18_9FLAO|nr:sensor of ECF-type sigma factor [Xanthomarina spongicola]PWK17885.1 hypothetical protein LX78_02283 [Xanthomarina spongicola]
MKNILITLFALVVSLTTYSQNDKHEKIKTLKIAYITEALDLTTPEAEKFWPIYNTYENEQDKLRSEIHEKRKNIDFETLTESDAKKIIDDMEALAKTRYELNRNYMSELKSVLTSKKIIKLREAEESFKRKMFEEYRKRHRPEGKSKP